MPNEGQGFPLCALFRSPCALSPFQESLRPFFRSLPGVAQPQNRASKGCAVTRAGDCPLLLCATLGKLSTCAQLCSGSTTAFAGDLKKQGGKEIRVATFMLHGGVKTERNNAQIRQQVGASPYAAAGRPASSMDHLILRLERAGHSSHLRPSLAVLPGRKERGGWERVFIHL